jgi:hypothetical protein
MPLLSRPNKSKALRRKLQREKGEEERKIEHLTRQLIIGLLPASLLYLYVCGTLFSSLSGEK